MGKVVIIEGCDRTGKDSLIEKLIETANTYVVCHAGVPKSSNLYRYYYDGIIHDTLEYYYNKTDLIIHNRSMYGEYVYGPKYRNESKEEMAKLINNLEVGQLRTFISESELFLILLTSSNTDLIYNNRDGLSLSDKKEDLEYEFNAFDEIFEKSIIKNKKKIFVNNGNNFRDKEDIYKDVLNFINNDLKEI